MDFRNYLIRVIDLYSDYYKPMKKSIVPFILFFYLLLFVFVVFFFFINKKYLFQSFDGNLGDLINDNYFLLNVNNLVYLLFILSLPIYTIYFINSDSSNTEDFSNIFSGVSSSFYFILSITVLVFSFFYFIIMYIGESPNYIQYLLQQANFFGNNFSIFIIKGVQLILSFFPYMFLFGYILKYYNLNFKSRSFFYFMIMVFIILSLQVNFINLISMYILYYLKNISYPLYYFFLILVNVFTVTFTSLMFVSAIYSAIENELNFNEQNIDDAFDHLIDK